MRTTVRLLVATATFWAAWTVAEAQSVYTADLTEAAGTLRAIMVRIDQMPADQRTSAVAVRVDLLELEKRLHRINEEAARADLALIKQGAPHSRQLAYVGAVSDELDLARSMMNKFLDTRDPVFWTAGLQEATAAREMMASGGI